MHAPEILSSISCILLMLISMVPDLFPRVSISRVVSLWVLFTISISPFRSWIVFFNFITCLVVFSCNYLRHFCVSSLRTSTCLAVFSFNYLRTSTFLSVFSCIFLSELLLPFLKSSTSVMRYDFFVYNLLFLLLRIFLNYISNVIPKVPHTLPPNAPTHPFPFFGPGVPLYWGIYSLRVQWGLSFQ